MQDSRDINIQVVPGMIPLVLSTGVSPRAGGIAVIEPSEITKKY